VLCAVGLCATLFSCLMNAYPFLDVANPLQFGVKIIVTTLVANVLGYVFYRSRAA
jgi:glutamate:GABA antiporter